MGSGRKSNGFRPVNKVDGGKKRARKQMHKTRRYDNKKLIRIEMTRKEAKRMGLLRCADCGYPENNHFDFDNRPCAHDSTCSGYQESSKIGRILK